MQAKLIRIFEELVSQSLHYFHSQGANSFVLTEKSASDRAENKGHLDLALASVSDSEQLDHRLHVVNEQSHPHNDGLVVASDSFVASLQQVLVLVGQHFLHLLGLVVQGALQGQHQELCGVVRVFNRFDELNGRLHDYRPH